MGAPKHKVVEIVSSAQQNKSRLQVETVKVYSRPTFYLLFFTYLKNNYFYKQSIGMLYQCITCLQRTLLTSSLLS